MRASNILIFSISLLIVMALTLLPIPERGDRGAYNTISGLAWCRDYSACLHEIGHALDRQAGWISQSAAFAEAVRMYIMVNARRDDAVVHMMTLILASDKEPVKAELYAWLFEYAGGRAANMPSAFVDFYDWQAADVFLASLDASRRVYLWRH